MTATLKTAARPQAARPVAPEAENENMTPAPSPVSVHAKFTAARQALSKALIERNGEIDLVLTALVAGEHALMVGPPGCGKSLLMDSILDLLDGPTFSCLLHKSVPVEEIMGQISIRALREEDVFRRNVAGRLPAAEVAALDEIFNASAPSLSPLLRILNEGVYEVDGRWVKSPLRSAIAGSNIWPQTEQNLEALFDRFVFRKEVFPIRGRAGKQRLWDFDGDQADHRPAFTYRITADELAEAQEAAAALPWADDAKEAFGQIIQELTKEGIIAGDRREKKAVMAARAAAWLAGSPEVQTDHLEILSHVLWVSPEDQPRKAAEIVGKVANPLGQKVTELLVEVEEIVAGANPKNLSEAAAATSKLSEIAKQIKALGSSDPRVKDALDYTTEQSKQLRLRSLESI